MRNLIIDPFAAFIAAHNMFAPADYFCEDAAKLKDEGDDLHIKRHMEKVSRDTLAQRYNIKITDIENINKEYDKIIIVFMPDHINDPGTNNWNSYGDSVFDDRTSLQKYFLNLAHKLEKIKHNHLIFLDFHDRAGTSIGEKWFEENFLPYHGIFKREYRRTHLYDYSKKVYPFPFLMFGTNPINSCTLLFEKRVRGNAGINECVWPGPGYNNMPLGTRDTWCNRQSMLNRLSPHLRIVFEPNHESFLQLFNRYKMFIHLNGHGHICKRMFEGLSRDSLMIMEEMDIVFPFENEDFFADKCVFTYPQEFVEKINLLKTDQSVYNECKEQQEYILNKYYNYNWIHNYVNSKLI
jgi:hypothetical protein